MTISSTNRKAGPFIGNGSASVFAFSFRVFAASDLEVVRITVATGVETTLTINSAYTVSLNADQNSNPGGSITLTGGALASGYNLIITSDIANLQPTDLTNQGGFYPEVITGALDRATIQIQQLDEHVNRTLAYPITDPSLGVELPAVAQRKGTVLAFNATTGAPEAGPTIAAIGTVSGNTSDINTVAANIASVNTTAGSIANVNTVGASIGSVNTVSGINASVTAVAAINNKVVIAADNVADINNFADVYQGGKAADPTLRNDSTALQTGDLYFNTVNDRMRVYETGTGWIDYEATAQTAATTATTQASAATAQAVIATTQAGLAATARTGAETARDAAFGNANVYTSTAAGLADTTNGQQFQVVVGSDIVRYQNTSGSAVEVARYPNTAAINALQNSIGENVWWDNNSPEFRGRNGTTSVPNADGTFTLGAIYTDMSVYAIDRFAVGKYVSLSVRLVSGTGTADLPSSRIRFYNVSNATISTVNVSATPDEWGYYSAHNVVVPATTSYIEALADAASGDTLEIIFSHSKFTYACRKASPTRPAIVGGNNRDFVPVKLAQVRQAAQVFPQPNGTRGTWESLVAQRGSSASSTALAALQSLEDDLNVSGFKHKLAYLNMRCGNDSIAALTPFIDRFGYGYDQTPTTFTFVEANGMAHSLTARVYLGPAFTEMGAYGCSLGAYLLNDVADNGTVLWDFGTWTLQPLWASYHIHDAWSAGNGRVLSTIGRTLTKGMLIGSRGPDGVNRIFRNGIVYGENTAVTSLGTNPTNSGTINFARGASAGDFVGYGLTVDEMCALTWMFQRFNTALGRAVTVDGLFS